MLVQLDPLTRDISFYATLMVIAAKFAIGAFIGRRVAIQAKEQSKRRLTFLGAAFLLFMCLAISRAIYFYYDFYLTNFVADQLWRQPQIYFWQAATCISGYSSAFMLFVLERDIYRFKTCLIPTGAVVVTATVQLLFPIKSAEDFQLVSTIGLVGTLALLLTIITFIYLAVKSTGLLRKVCVVIMIGFLFYAIASMAMGENILAALDAAVPGIRTPIIVAVPIIKIFSFIVISWGVVHFQL